MVQLGYHTHSRRSEYYVCIHYKVETAKFQFLNAPSGPYLYVQFISTKDILKGMVQAPVRLRFPFRRDEFRACRHHHKSK